MFLNTLSKLYQRDYELQNLLRCAMNKFFGLTLRMTMFVNIQAYFLAVFGIAFNHLTAPLKYVRFIGVKVSFNIFFCIICTVWKGGTTVIKTVCNCFKKFGADSITEDCSLCPTTTHTHPSKVSSLCRSY